MAELTGVVVAGGRSERLGGRAKPLVRVGGQLVLARIEAALRPLCTEIVLVVRRGQDDGVADTGLALRMHVVEDRYERAGPLAGFEAGLSAAVTELVFVTGGDHPFVSRAVVKMLVGLADGADAVVPEVGGLLQPLHAVYRQSVAGEVRAALDGGARSPVDIARGWVGDGRALVVSEEELRAVDARLASFVDIDTEQDLARARRMVRRSDVVRGDIQEGGV